MNLEDIIKSHIPCTCSETYKSRGLTDPNCVLCEHGEEIALIAVEFDEQQTHLLSRLYTKLYTKPRQVLKPLEDLYRKENPLPNGRFYLPDETEFFKWIVEKTIIKK